MTVDVGCQVRGWEMIWRRPRKDLILPRQALSAPVPLFGWVLMESPTICSVAIKKLPKMVIERFDSTNCIGWQS